MIEALRGLGHEVRIVAPAVGGDEGRMGDDVGWVHRLKAVLPRALYELMELGYSLVAYRKLVAQAAQGLDHFLDVHGLAVLAGGAVVVEDAHGASGDQAICRRGAASRANSAA